MRLNGKPIEADRKYKVAGWAPVSEEAKTTGGKPIWDLVEPWLKAKGHVSARKLNAPRLAGVGANRGMAL
jgi:sulfur-oxidizing protein SoxB